MSHDAAGAYVLGALGAAERQEFESHLADCAECRDRVTELAGLPGLLARVTPADLADPPAVPETLLPGLLVAMRRRQRRRTTYLLVAAAAAVVIAVAGVGVLRAHPSAPTSVTLVAVATSPLHATAQVTATSGGSRIALRCTYSGSDTGWTGPHSRPYRLVVTDDAGTRSTLATWRVGPDHVVSVNGSVGVPPSRITTIEVSTTRGSPLLRWRS